MTQADMEQAAEIARKMAEHLNGDDVTFAAALAAPAILIASTCTFPEGCTEADALGLLDVITANTRTFILKVLAAREANLQ